MIDLKKLIDFLPFEYKDQDTYKVDGKGILERFLEICGSYFQDNISADIESLLGITDFDTCPEIYLNYLWESFGQLPFARWNNIDEGAFKTYYNGLLSEAELNSLKSKWILPKKGALALTTKQIRDLLKYSISLIKIRGTSQFFEILFRMYGLNCTIDDPAKSGYDGWLKTHPYFDQDQYYDKSNFDNIYGCSQCINVTFHITGHGYSNNSGEFIEFRKAIENIIDRFKPYHVGATIDYGFNINDNYLITADFVDPNINTIQPGYITSVPIKVTVSSNYQNADLRYQVSGDGNTWGYKKYENGTIFNANIPTEEVFSAPQYNGVNGIVYSTKPLIYQGNTISDFSFTFKEGKIVDYTAKEGYEVLKELIETDEGSHYLGEVALVDHFSPISQSNQIFYETLFDENASCHLAIGASYPTCLKNSDGLSEEELKERGLNSCRLYDW